MKKILVIGASNSSTSINRTLAAHAGTLLSGCQYYVLDLNDFEMPLYSPEREADDGIPAAAVEFVEHIQGADAIILSLAEHNGTYTAAFKNILDWASRHEQKLWSNKPMLLLSASPGARGGASVMAAANATFPHLGAEIKASFSLPSYYDNFSTNEGITDPVLSSQFQSVVNHFAQSI